MDKIREKIVKQELMCEKIYSIAMFFTFLAWIATAWLAMMIFLLFLRGVDFFNTALAIFDFIVPILVDLICIALWIIYKRLSKSIEHLKCKLRTLWYAGVKE